MSRFFNFAKSSAISIQSAFSKSKYSKHSSAVFSFSDSFGDLLPLKSSVTITPQVAISFCSKILVALSVGFFK